jgi:hypothetical protein
MEKRYAIFAIVSFMFLYHSVFAKAVDHRNLEENLPLAVEDAYPIEFRSVELQGRFSYGLFGNNDDQFLLEPRVEAGILKNSQLTIKVPIVFGDDGAFEGSGNIGVGALYNFNVETNLIPAFSLSVQEEFPSGKDTGAFETTIKGIITKGFNNHRFNFNGSYINVANEDKNERNDLYFFGIGYDYPISIDAIFLADFFTMRAKDKGVDNLYIGEVGIRYAINPWSVLSLSVGTGFGSSDEAAEFSVTIGYQTNRPPLPF